MARSAKDVIKEYRVKLLQELSLDDQFFEMAQSVNLFPSNFGNIYRAKIKSYGVNYLLRHVVEPRAEEYLPKLLEVMKESQSVNVRKLAYDIQAKLVTIGTPFECWTMAEYLTNNLHLFQKLSYRKMRHFLVPYGVLTDEEQSQIDRRNHDEKYQMTDVITNIVNHLYYNRTSQLKGFLRLLEEDGDPDFKKIAITLGGSEGVPADPKQRVLNKILDNLVQKKKHIEITEWPPRQINNFTKILMRYRDMASVEDDVIANNNKEGALAIDKLMSSKNKNHLNNVKEIFVSKDITAFNCIIIEGAPGIGKSMLAKRIEFLWMKKEILKQYKGLFSIPFNKIQRTLSVAELFKNMTSGYLDSEEIHMCHKYFTNNSENQLCILIDELDDDSVINPFITNLICGQILPNALVIIFSQPTCTLKLPLVQEKVKRIEIIGFNKAMQKNFILKSLGSLHMKELVKYLKIHPMVNEICYKPFYLAIVVHLFKQGDLPKTITKMYKLLILHTIYRHMKKHDFTSLDMDFNEIQDIPNKQLCTVVENLSRLAFKALKNNKNLFAMDEIINECPNINDVVGTVKGFGLLQCYIQQEDAKSIKFGFCHHSMQEYLAAYYISHHLSPEEQLSEMKATFWNFWNGQFKYMWIMFAGITGITSATTFGKFLNPSQNKTWSEDLSQLELPEEIGEDKEKCSYLNQYFKEAEIVKKPNKVLEHYMEYILNQAKQEKITVYVRHTKVMICGASGAGKTCLTCLLKHTTIPEEYKSTDVGESMQIFVVNKKEKQKDENITWTELDESKEIDKITNRLLTYIMKKKMDEEDKLDDSENESDDLMNESSSSFDNNMKSNQNDDKGNKIGQPIQTDSDTFNSTNSTFEDTRHVDSVDKDIAASAAVKSNKSIDSVNSEVEETWDVLTLLDTGGQPEFINLLPAICRSTTVTFVVLNMLDGIEKKLTAKHSDKQYKERTLNYNNEHLTKSLLSVIKESSESKMTYLEKCCKKVNDPPESPGPGVCFAATHCDEISDPDQLVLIFEGMCEAVDAISDENKVGKLDILNYEGHIVTKIDNTLAGKQEMANPNSIANKLRQFVNKHQEFQPVYEIPITWLILELELRKQSKVCLKFEDVEKISERIFHGIELSDDELKIALQFFHDFGVLLYFNELEEFNNYVVKDMNWLFKVLTKLASEEIFKGTTDYDNNDCKSFRNGFFKERLLDVVQLNTNIDDIDKITKDIDKILFLKLLEHLKIAASMTDEDNSGEFKYFMPCILKICPWERPNDVTKILDDRFGKQIVKEEKKEEKVNPLLIKFTSCPIPRGLFCFLVVSLIQFKENNWKFEPYLNLRGSQEGYRHPFANLIVLKVSNKASYDGHFSLSLHDRILYLELQIRIQRKKPLSIYHDIKNIVYDRLSKICKQFGWKYDNLECGFPCNCVEPPHMVLSSDLNVWECEQQEEYEPTISDQIWLKDISDDLTSDSTCELTGLVPHTKYQFRVAAINAAGRGPFTDVVTQFTSGSKRVPDVDITKVFNNEKCPLKDCLIISKTFDYNGGELVIKEHAVKVTVPIGAIDKYCEAQIEVAASLFGPFIIPEDYEPISVYVWIGACYKFKKEVMVEMEHDIVVNEEENIPELCILTACEKDKCDGENNQKLKMHEDTCEYELEKLTCTVFTSHFCSICLAIKMRGEAYRARRIIMYHYLPEDYISAKQFTAEVCFCCDLQFYKERTEERYSKRRMKQEPCVPIEIFNWKKDKFCLSYPDKLEGWEICHYGYDEIISEKLNTRNLQKSSHSVSELLRKIDNPPCFMLKMVNTHYTPSEEILSYNYYIYVKSRWKKNIKLALNISGFGHPFKGINKPEQSTELSRALSCACRSVSEAWKLITLDNIYLGDKKLDGLGTVIAILDTAIDTSCFTTKQKFSHINVHDFLNNVPVSSRDHGTICSAVAVGSAYVTSSGLVIPRGVAPGAELVVYRIADKGNGDTNAILNVLEDIKQKALMGSMKVDVVSISYDLDEKYIVEIHSKIGELTEMGIIFVAAAGNRGLYQAHVCIPACFDNVISVGALNGYGELAPYTSRANLDVYAPGEYQGCRGTSYATPAVAGLVLLLKQWANHIRPPAKKYINRVDILRKIFTEDMFVKSDITVELVDTSQPTVKKDSDGTIRIFQPVDFFMNMKDHPEKLNEIIQEHLNQLDGI